MRPVLLAGLALALALPPAAALPVSVGTPTEDGPTTDQCAQMNSRTSGKCVVVTVDGVATYYVYSWTETCTTGGVPNAPAVGIWRESNGKGGLQTSGTGQGDFGVLSTCGPWAPP